MTVFAGITAVHLARAAWTFAALGRARTGCASRRPRSGARRPTRCRSARRSCSSCLSSSSTSTRSPPPCPPRRSPCTASAPCSSRWWTSCTRPSRALQIGLAEVEGAGQPPRAGLPLFHEAVLQLAFAFLPLVGLLGVVAPALIELLFSARYLDAVPIFRIGIPLGGARRAAARRRDAGARAEPLHARALRREARAHRPAGPRRAPGRRAHRGARGLDLRGGGDAGGDAPPDGAPVRGSALPRAPLRSLARQVAATVCGMGPAWLAVRALDASLPVRLAAAGAAFAAAYLGLSWARGWLPADGSRCSAPGRARTAAAPSEP